MVKIYRPDQGLVCGEDYKCLNEAKWIPADFSLALREDEDQEAADLRARSNVACGVHGPGVQKRSLYRTSREYVSLDSRPEVREAALRSRFLERERDEQSMQEQRDKNHESARRRAVISWTQADNEPEYVLIEEWVSRHYNDNLDTHQWSAYTVEQAETGAAEDGARRYSPQFRVRVDQEQRYDDVTDRATIDTTISSSMTPKLARLYAEALVKVAAAVDEANRGLREKHNAEVAEHPVAV